MEMTFEKSVDVLVKAYLNNTLTSLDPCGCAVGNLLKACGVGLPHKWYSLLFLNRASASGIVPIYTPETTIESANEELSHISYTIEQIDLIEKTFEKNASNQRYTPNPDYFEALMNVVDVLAEIHGVDLETKKEAKSLFVKECV